MSYAEFDADIVIDTRDCIVGRVASEVASRALSGDHIAVINAEQAVITGSEDDIMDVYRTRDSVGSDKGPHYPKQPDRLLKRAIRGMLPYKEQRGRDALENVRVYIGNPFEEDGEILDDASLDRVSTIKFLTLGEISENLGANVTW